MSRNHFLLVSVFLIAIYIFFPSVHSSYAQTLTTVEINEYEGTKLGSIKDFRENSIKGIQEVNPDTYTLVVDGLVETPLSFTLEELTEKLPRAKKVIRIDCVEGWAVTCLWEGFLITDLINLSVPKKESKIIIFHAVDGYTTSLPLEYIKEKNIMLADHINGIVLPQAQGFPLQLVAEDKWGYKWIRWITRLELSDDERYKGYWESRGYSNQGDIDKSMFGD
ncbi:MAG: molybdopterin-dependent oxidoreductase [Aminobacterium sp.]|uniref:molybdopterin-dependent oxidoreductase n=1 Tax=unclassified Aminobacterium TaxID=2685012 RepID=UPI0027DE122A|nr:MULTISPECIES: molybdopterin-dependent oxidoreductase [unclassified Aminobacterium]MDD2206781.1 molybdopterin-dependent oxidoreductase [Aminobacterium sp.]MDD3426228.1 molybdopterin-dependent oxidoreductase [Aminobacterium sp.]MDD4229109.1 molybdopterin-dependent oxidoreductase [Aminobacterium sp.]MDD4552310.1 molybdopterin-dependent oxidoreductase [Aminobacterium sp.]MEA4878419.1 molybdopterin-dependent oxidoreductase [Aminobacterium sp.]